MATPIQNLNIAEMIVTQEPIVVCTVLGSCVSVCLFSKATGAGGIIHFALPTRESANDQDSLRYGDYAIAKLIEELSRLTGEPPSRFSAKIAGGANNVGAEGHLRKIGDANVVLARQMLKKAGIPIVGEDVGGEVGRKILFHIASGRLQSAFVGQGFTRPSALKASQQPLEKRKVLIVDDSKTIRGLLRKIIEQDARLELVGEADDPIMAEPMVEQLRPDVITLDIHMPAMTGVQWLRTLLPKHKIPVVMVTSLEFQDGNEVFQALELGAVDYIQKPGFAEMKEFGPMVREKIFSASHASVRLETRQILRPAVASLDMRFKKDWLIAIGASTGGTEALREVLQRLPDKIPPVLIVQHIPPVFSTAFAKRLNSLLPFEVKEAENGDAVHENRVLIAPGGRQMKLIRRASGLFVEVNDHPLVNRHKPSVDYLFRSVAEISGEKAAAAILTGMGADGAEGLLEIKKRGAVTFSQDEKTCVVYGMPKAAWELGASSKQVALEDMAEHLINSIRADVKKAA